MNKNCWKYLENWWHSYSLNQIRLRILINWLRHKSCNWTVIYVLVPISDQKGKTEAEALSKNILTFSNYILLAKQNSITTVHTQNNMNERSHFFRFVKNICSHYTNSNEGIEALVSYQKNMISVKERGENSARKPIFHSVLFQHRSFGPLQLMISTEITLPSWNDFANAISWYRILICTAIRAVFNLWKAQDSLR